MKSIILIAAAVWAATAPLPKRARFYFWVEVVGTLFAQLLRLAGVEVNDPAYEIAYTISALGIITAGFYLVLETLRVYALPYRVLLIVEGTIATGFMTFLAVYSVLREYNSFPYFLYLVMGEAALLSISGMALAFATPLLRGRDRILGLVLSIAWIGRAAILYSYSINILGNVKLWLAIGSWLPALLFISTCAYLGSKMRLMKFETLLSKMPKNA